MKKLTIIKIGGKVIDDPNALDRFLKDLAKIEGRKILVHGGGKVASEFGQRLDIQPKLVDGRRITDKATLDLVTMVYGGLINKQIVAKLQAFGTNAIGLTGADANVLSAVKRPVGNVDYGYVGDVTVQDVNSDRLEQWLYSGLLPVFCALTHDLNGSLLNTNADTIASILASALAQTFEVSLIYCFEQKGVLSDFEKEIVIGSIDSESYKTLKDNEVIADGMIPKMDNAFDALNAGVNTVRIGHFTQLLQLTEGRVGTQIMIS